MLESEFQLTAVEKAVLAWYTISLQFHGKSGMKHGIVIQMAIFLLLMALNVYLLVVF